MESIITSKLYGKVGVKTTDYDIKHAKGLSNEVNICQPYSEHLLTVDVVQNIRQLRMRRVEMGKDFVTARGLGIWRSASINTKKFTLFNPNFKSCHLVTSRLPVEVQHLATPLNPT